jgi:uncharacterized membrane protein HdeD (DUF308 family)
VNDRLTRTPWLVALRGLAAIAFGLIALFMPGITLLALVLLFGAYAIVDGVFKVVSGVRKRPDGSRDGWTVLAGILGIAAGVVAAVWPGITALVLLVLIASWAIVTGAFEIVAAYRLREQIEGEAMLALGGALSIAFGVLALLMPGAGALAVVWLIGAYAVATGIVLLIAAYRLNQRQRRHDRTTTGGDPATGSVPIAR